MRTFALIGLAAVLVLGCGKKEDSFAKRVGEAIGQQATDFTTGVG